MLQFPANAERNYPKVNVQIDGQLQAFSQPAIIYNDLTLVPMRELFEAIGAEVDWNEKTKKITAAKDETTIELTLHSKQAFKNVEIITLDVEPMNIDGHTMVPLRFVSEAFGDEISYKKDTKLIEIDTNKEAANDSKVSSEEKKAEDPNLLTFDEAFKKAIASSTTIGSLKLSAKQAEERRDEASDILTYTPIGTGNGEGDSSIRSATSSLKQQEINRQSTKKELELEEDKVAYNLQKVYYGVLQAERALEVSELSYEQAKTDMYIIEEKQKSALASEVELKDAATKVEEANNNLQSAKQDVIDAYEQLNKQIGTSMDNRYTLEQPIEYEALEDENPDYQVAKVLSDNITVWLAEQQIELAQLQLDLYTFNTGSLDNYTVKELDVDKKEYELADTKKQIEMNIRSIFNSIKQQESQYLTLQSNLEKAKRNQETIKTKYNFGMATTYELLQAKLNVKQLEQQLFDTKVQLNTLRTAYEKPWAAS